jgi:arylsulfatase A-like enzyme
VQHVLRRRWLPVAVGIVVAGLLAGSWWARSLTPRTNLLLITLDTTHADRIGAWSGPENLTPILDQLASHSVVFKRAYAPVPLTLPSHASLMTGLHPPEHGLRVNSGLNRLGSDVPVLSDRLRRRGYRTGAFLGSFVLDRKFGLDRGFEVYDDQMEEAHGPTPGDPHGHKMRTGERVVDSALSWLKRRRREPFFCWVHLFDPHTPYNAREELFGDQFRNRPYDAGIAYVDRQVGRLLKFLRQTGLEDRTLVVVVGDHGESLGEHQERSHGFTLYEAALHVPLIIRCNGPDAQARRISTPVSLVDLCPTLLAALDPGSKLTCSGRSLLPACRGEDLPQLDLYAETDHPFEECGAAPLRGLVTNRWKYIRSPRPELYDLPADPREHHNLAEQRPTEVAELERLLQQREAELVLRDAPTVVISPHEKRKLASLGYSGGGATPQVDDSQWPDVKDMLPQYNAYSDAQELLSAGNFQDACAILEAVVLAAPNFFQAWYNMGNCRERLGDIAGAEAAYRRAVEIDGNATAQTALAGLYLSQNQPEKAIPPLEIAVRLQPELVRGPFLLGEAYRLLRRFDEARQSYLQALQAAPDFVPAQNALRELPDQLR